MMEISKKVNIYWTTNKSGFRAANPDMVIEEGTRSIGSARKAVSQMLANGEEQRALMGTILGIDPESMTSNWDKELKNYWDSLSIMIPPSGRPLEVGFSYDIKSQNTKIAKNIKELKEEHKDIKATGHLSEYVESKVEEQYKYRYGTPINIEDYILWRYCLIYGYVGNSIEDVAKAPKKIKFYLFSETERKEEAKAKHSLKNKIISKYLEVIKDAKLMDSILIVNGTYEVDKMETIDKEKAIDTLSMKQPQKFLKLTADKHIEAKADIEKLVFANILRRLPNTSKIVDANDVTKTIGESLDDAVAFFSSDKNKAIVSEYIQIYKHNKKE